MVVSDSDSDLALANLRKTWATKHEHIKDFLDYLTGYQECPGDCGRPDLEVIGRSRGRVTWDKPKFEGSSPIIAYKVEVAYESKPSRWIQLGICASCEMIASGLEEGGLWIRVSAGNVHGYGPPRQSGMLIMKPEPGPPVMVRALECQTLDEDNLKLSCQITGYPIPTVVWSRGQTIIQDFGGRIKIERDDEVYSMTIGDATQDDSGLYCLEAMNPIGRITSYTFVSVSKKPQLSGVDETIYRRPVEVERAPVFELGLKDRTVEAFTTVLLGCQVSGHPKPVVTWFKDGEPLEESDNVVITQDDEFHSVEVSYARPEDCGEYKCQAHNSFGTLETTCDLQVVGPIEPPTFEHPLEQDVEAVVGGTVRITTVVSCYTRPTITWFKDGDELKQRKERVFSHSFDGTVELCLAYLTEVDSGEYTCTATCPAGSISSTHQLCVNRVPSPPPPSPSSTPACSTPVPTSKKPLFLARPRCTEVLEGETIRFWVQVIGDPQPKVIWYRDNLKVDYYREKSQFVTETDGDNHWLEIRRCKFPFTGHYLAYASNSHGTANARFSLQVFAKECRKDMSMEPGVVREADVQTLPVITQPLSDTLCEPGSSITLECRLKGEPFPDIIWTKDGKVFKHGVKWIDGDTAGLTLNAATEQDGGVYKCEAWNCLGKASTSSCLSVKGEEAIVHGPVAPCITRTCIDEDERTAKRGKRASPARFLTVPHNRVVILGDSVRFICSAGGYPLPVASWFKDGAPVATSSRLRVTEDEDVHCLEIDRALLGDAGKYTVVLENKKGSAEASATLQVVSHRREGQMVSKDYYQFGRKYRESKEAQIRERRPSTNDQPIQETSATEGSTFTLSCHVGTPSSATWFKDGEPLPDEERRRTWEEDGLARLELGPLQLTDTGLYSCRLDREWGLSQGLVRLTVTPVAHQEIKPPIFIRGLPREIIAHEGLPCLIRATISGEEPLRVVWSKNSDDELPDCEDMSHVDLGNGEIALRLADTFVEDSGLYTCTVYNSHGMAQSHTRLVVKEDASDDKSETPARILAGPVDCVVLRGGKAILTSLFSGSPLPTVMWSKGGVEISRNDRVSVQTDMDEGQTNLVIDPVEADDSGKYVLTVYNHLATDYHFASLSVEGVPDPPADRPIVEPRGAGRVVVAWSSPHFDGGSMITGYSVEMMTSSSEQWSTVAERCHSLSYYVSGLSDGETYTFRVRSHNVHGSSDPSAYSQPITLKKAPELPFGAVEFEDGRLFNERYQKLEELGKGRYGVVHRVRENATGRDLAAKIVRCIKKVDRDKTAQELAIMNRLRHSKLLQLMAAYDGTREIVLVLEYISGGELFERVVADDFTLTEKDCILFMRQICEGVAYMHDQSVVHLDLKPENIMCTTRDSHEIKIIDFGLAQKLEDDTPVRVLFGTPEFIAPEIINYEPIGTQTDMWSVGVICYVLLSGLSPFMGDNDAETFANITRADYDFDDDAFDSISHTAKEFICELLVKRKEKRLNAKECLAHKWMSQEDTAMSQVKLCTDKLKKFIIRRKWQKTGNAIRALGRMASLSAATRRGSSSPIMGNRASPTVQSPATSVTDQGEKRGRQCSERSDSGFSDCSTTGSLTATTTRLLADKKYSITEEAEDPIKELAHCQDERTQSQGLEPVKQKPSETHHSPPSKRPSKNENVQKAFAFWNR